LLDATAAGPIVRFPMRDHQGRVVGFKQRRGDGLPIKTGDGETKSKTEAGTQHGLFIPCALPPDETVAVVEGEADVAAALSAAWFAVVGTAGANLGALARTALQLLLAGRRCVLFPHDDGGGPTWLADVGALLVNAQCEVRFVPADPKKGDLDERLRAVKREDRPAMMRELMESAVPWPGDAGPASRSWQILTLADAYAPQDPLVYIVQEVIIRPSVIIFYGAPGVLKSFLVMDMAMCVAGGLPWLPPGPSGHVEPKLTVQVPVLWVDFDNGRRRTAERVRALATAYGLEADKTLFSYVSMPMPGLDAANSESVGRLIRILKEREIALCVLDNLGTVSAGADENSPEMIRVMAHLRHVAEGAEASMIPIHHQRKTSQFAGRLGESLRGHSSIEAAIDLALLCERPEGASHVVVRSTKSRDIEVPPFGAVFSYTHKEGTQELATARFYGMAVEDACSAQALRKAILDTVRAKRTLNQSQLVAEVQKALPKAAVNRVRELADELVKEGALTAPTGERGAKLYSVPPTASQFHGGRGKPP
jgi:hypothetical protein